LVFFYFYFFHNPRRRQTYVFGGLDADAVDANAQLVGLVELGKDRVDVRVLAQLVQARHMPQVDAAVHGQLGPGLLCLWSRRRVVS
jgi:hypothetical protein